jgi:hypothetical protein
VGGAAGGTAMLVLLAAARRPPEEPRMVRDLSPPAALAALAVAGLVLGAELGQWLSMISAGLRVVALAGLVRE